jgi:putative hydrolase of the HAD superfamily
LIELVVFDMDGVLVQLDRARRLALLAELTGKDTTFLQAVIWDSDFEQSAEAGVYPTGAEYLGELNRRAQSTLSREQWVRARREATSVHLDALELARELSARCEIALLTNNGSLLHEALPEIVPELYALFGARAHASFQFNARKPEPSVFTRLLARYGVEPACAVFVDDDETFVTGARRAGLHGITFRGIAELRVRLAELGLRISD